jgi:long-chain fatty acid transport protein
MLTLLIALSPVAQAGGYYSADQGVRANGRGQAFTAGADDISAQLYNPAALVRLERPQFSLHLAGVSQSVEFDRLDDNGLTFDPVENSSLPYLIPNFGFASSFGVEGLGVAIGLYTPYAPTFLYPEDGAQRYSLVESSVLETNFGPSVAYRVTDWLSLGAGFAWKVLGVTQDLTITTSKGDDPTHDVGVNLNAYDWSTFSWNAGVLLEPVDWLSIGVQYTPSVHYEATGSFEADLSENFFYTSGLLLSDTATDDEITLVLDMPQILRTGVAVRPIEGLELEVDYVFAGWSIVEQLLVTDVELELQLNEEALGNLGIEVEDATPTADDDIILPANYKNTHAVRFGAEYDINDVVAVRAGGLYELAAVPTKTLSVQLVDGVKYGYSVGATARPWDRWSFDGVWAQTFLAPLDITNSEYHQVWVAIDLADPSAPPEITDGEVVGNGSYTSSIQIFGLSATHYFGKGG